MTLVSWAKKELARLKLQSPKRLLSSQPTLKASSNYTVSSQVSEVVLAADLRCIKCQDRVEAMISTLNDLESIVVHLADKKVTLTRQPNHSF